jgi:hypothetical protein
MSQRVLGASLIVAMIMTFWKAQPGKGASLEWPMPSRFVGVALIWTILAILAVPAPQLAAAFGVGIDVAVFLGFQPGQLAPGATKPNPGTTPAMSGG